MDRLTATPQPNKRMKLVGRGGRQSGEGVYLIAAVLACSLHLAASSPMPAQVAPTQALQAAFDALARRDWRALAALVAPTALDSLRQESLGLTILQAEQRKAGKEVGGGYNPGEVVIADRLREVGSERASELPGSPTIAELTALSPTDFFVRWCEAVYGPSSKRDQVREVAGLYRRVIGYVREDNDLSQVLYRRETRWVDMSQLHVRLPGRLMVMPLKRVQNQWRLLLNDDLGWSVDFMALTSASSVPSQGA